jgi:hypothetical protein
LKSKKLKYTFAIVAFILYQWFTSINSISLDNNEYRYKILLWKVPLKEIVSLPIYDGAHGWNFSIGFLQDI